MAKHYLPTICSQCEKKINDKQYENVVIVFEDRLYRGRACLKCVKAMQTLKIIKTDLLEDVKALKDNLKE